MKIILIDEAEPPMAAAGRDSPTDDGVLWERMRSGDQSALGELFDRYADEVYAFAFRRTASWTAAEDVVQATFLSTWRRFQRNPTGPLTGVLPNIAHLQTRLVWKTGTTGWFDAAVDDGFAYLASAVALPPGQSLTSMGGKTEPYGIREEFRAYDANGNLVPLQYQGSLQNYCSLRLGLAAVRARCSSGLAADEAGHRPGEVDADQAAPAHEHRDNALLCGGDRGDRDTCGHRDDRQRETAGIALPAGLGRLHGRRGKVLRGMRIELRKEPVDDLGLVVGPQLLPRGNGRPQVLANLFRRHTEDATPSRPPPDQGKP
jgi:hypothetical protein